MNANLSSTPAFVHHDETKGRKISNTEFCPPLDPCIIFVFINACMYVCVYVNVYICLYICIYTYTHLDRGKQSSAFEFLDDKLLSLSLVPITVLSAFNRPPTHKNYVTSSPAAAVEATGGRAVLGKERRIEDEPCMPRVNDKVHAGRRRAHSNAPESFILECPN